MRNILLVASHLFSGSNALLGVLNENNKIDLIDDLLSYDHPSVLEYLFEFGHKLDNSSAIYGGQILFNKDLSCKIFYDFAKFIYVIRPAKPTLNEIKLNRKEYSELTAYRYYCFRLRRIYEMARSTPKAVLLKNDDIYSQEGLDLIQDYLDLKQPLILQKLLEIKEEETFSSSLVDKAQDCYEKYLYHLRQLDLRKL
jgi:hypothetical protein